LVPPTALFGHHALSGTGFLGNSLQAYGQARRRPFLGDAPLRADLPWAEATGKNQAFGDVGALGLVAPPAVEAADSVPAGGSLRGGGG